MWGWQCVVMVVCWFFLKLVLVGGVVATIVIVMADMGYCSYYVCFFSCNLLVYGRCGGFWCGGVVVSRFLCFSFLFLVVAGA